MAAPITIAFSATPTQAEAGVTRQMLESLDRAVRCEPEW